jgi:hypothetical protein
MVEYSDLVHAYLPSGSSAFQSADIVIDAYLGARVFGLAVRPIEDDFGVDWRTWTRNGRLLVGDNKYLADTVIDEFVTERKWTGGELARAYEWDDAATLEVTVNGYEINSGAFLADISRGSTTVALPYIGVKVQLFDNGGTEDTGADNGKVGKVVVTAERLAQVTKVDSVKRTIDFNLFTRDGNLANRKVSIKNYETDETYAVNDYILVIPQGVVDTTADAAGGYGIYDDGYAYDWNAVSLTAVPGVVLSVDTAKSVEIQATSYTRANQGNTTVQLATITVDSGDKYIVSALYAFGIGDTPSFTEASTLYLDSNGVVAGVSAETLSAASLKYLYVTGVKIESADGTFANARVRVSVIYADTYTSDILDLPITRSGTTYSVTINGAKVAITDDTDQLVNTGPAYDGKAVDGSGLIGWYWYTSISDSKVATLKSNAVIGLSTTPDAGPIVSETYGSAADGFGVYGVGTMAEGGGFAPRGVDGGFVSEDNSPYGSIYCNSASVLLYNGIKYTGYTRFPYAATDSAEYALAIRGKNGLIELIAAINTNPTVAAPATYAVIERIAYDAVWAPGTILYKVKGSTGAITTAGAYEVITDTSNPSYNTGDIVNIQADGSGGFKIVAVNNLPDGIRQYTQNTTGVPTVVQQAVVTKVEETNHEYFLVNQTIGTISSNTITMTVPPAANPTPFLDSYIYTTAGQGKEERSYPEVGDVVDLYFGYNGFAGVLEAVIIKLHNDDPAANVPASQGTAVTNAYNRIKNTAGVAQALDPAGLDVDASVVLSGSAVTAVSEHGYTAEYKEAFDLAVIAWLESVVDGGSDPYASYLATTAVTQPNPETDTAANYTAVGTWTDTTNALGDGVIAYDYTKNPPFGVDIGDDNDVVMVHYTISSTGTPTTAGTLYIYNVAVAPGDWIVDIVPES